MRPLPLSPAVRVLRSGITAHSDAPAVLRQRRRGKLSTEGLAVGSESGGEVADGIARFVPDRCNSHIFIKDAERLPVPDATALKM